MNLGRRLIGGAAIIAAFALVIGVAAIILGPGKTINKQQLSSVVLQAEDVPGGLQVDDCDDGSSSGEQDLPDGRISVFFQLGGNQDQSDSPTCLQATVVTADSEADAAVAFREYRDFYEEYERLLEDPNFEGAYKIERFDTPKLGSNSFSFSISCGRDCTPDSTRAYIIQFQRANLFSIVALGGPQNSITADDVIGYAMRQDERVVSALEAQ
jgi:hypothetical protein